MKKIIGIVIIMLLIGTTVSQVSACTGFTFDDENNVFACHNEDGNNFNFNMRFFPPKNNKNGMVFFEIPELQSDGTLLMAPYACMNDQGCCYTAYGTPNLEPVNSSDKPYFTNSDCYYKDHYAAIVEYCMAECSTVAEIIDILDDYNLEDWTNFQVFVADSTGASAIIEGDDVIYKEGDFQVISNFLQSHPELGDLADGFERYNIAVSMLENMTEPSVEYFRDILNSTRIELSTFYTVYSTIFNAENLIIYLYFLHDYEEVVVIDLNEELEKGENYYYIGSFFEPDGNQPPLKPEPPTGDEAGIPCEDKEYRIVKTTDPDGDKISYMFDWGDGTESLWLYSRMGVVKSTHNWTERGTYEIRVKARDSYGAESEWSDPLMITVPKNKMRYTFAIFMERLIERFPILEKLF